MRNLRIASNPESLFRLAADELVRIVDEAAAARGVCNVALSGGSTPKALYELLASPSFRERMPWVRTHLFWGDERLVPPDDAQSNYRMASEVLLRYAPIPAANVHRIHGEAPDAAGAAAHYENVLRHTLWPADGRPPRFDLILLGMGEDGHTASLFPGNAALSERSRWVVAPWVEKLHAHRVTLTFAVLNEAANILFVVSGRSKAETLERVFTGNESADLLPCRGVEPRDGRLTWFVDRAAASRLPQRSEEATL